MCPRRKPDEIIEHRISLGPYERERLNLVVAGNVFNKVSNPIVNLLSDVSGLAALVGILEAVGVLNIRKYIMANTPLDEWYNSVVGDLFTGYDEAMASLDTAYEETTMLFEEAGDIISDIEDIEIPGLDFGDGDENGTPFGLPTGVEAGRWFFGFPTGFVEGGLLQSWEDAGRYGRMIPGAKTVLGGWAWAKYHAFEVGPEWARPRKPWEKPGSEVTQ